MLNVMVDRKQYGNKEILKDFHLYLNDHDILALYGCNGSGKTTLISILSGLTDFDGDIMLDGVSLINCRYKYLSKVGIFLNDLFYYDFMTVNEFIDLTINIKGIQNEDKIYEYKQELMALLYLDKFSNCLMKNLSLGTKQKVMLLLSLIHKPELILFDEPLVNLDHASQENIIDYIRNYVLKNNTILIFSSHDTSLIQKLSNKVLTMEDFQVHNKDEWFYEK